MQALKLVAPKTMEIGALPDPPDPGPGEVLVRIRAVGVCGSDMHFYSEGGCAGNPAAYPQVLGHEPAGEIVEAGAGVEHLSAGMRVALEPTQTCGRCEACRSGRRNLCDAAIFMGGLQLPGLLREYAVFPVENVVRVPDDMSFSSATAVEPVAVVLHSLHLAGLEFGETVAIMGAGPIGLLMAAVAKLAGASRVVIADRVPHRLERARRLGVDAAVDIRSESVVEAVRDLTHGKGAHVVFDAAGKPESINAGLDSIRSGGRLIIIGIPSQLEVPIHLWKCLHNEITIRVQKRNNGNDHEALDLITSGKLDTSLILSHHFPLAQGDKAFALMDEYADGVIKPVVEL